MCMYGCDRAFTTRKSREGHVSAQSNVAARGDVVSAPHAVGEYDTNCTLWPSCSYSAYVHCLSAYVFFYNNLSADLRAISPSKKCSKKKNVLSFSGAGGKSYNLTAFSGGYANLRSCSCVLTINLDLLLLVSRETRPTRWRADPTPQW